MSDWRKHRGVSIYIPICESDGYSRAFVNGVDVSGPDRSPDTCYAKAQEHIDRIIAEYELNRQDKQ